MTEKIILLSDHTWYAVYDKEEAQRFVNNHEWGNTPFAYGIYIEPHSDEIGQGSVIAGLDDIITSMKNNILVPSEVLANE